MYAKEAGIHHVDEREIISIIEIGYFDAWQPDGLPNLTCKAFGLTCNVPHSISSVCALKVKRASMGSISGFLTYGKTFSFGRSPSNINPMEQSSVVFLEIMPSKFCCKIAFILVAEV